ncbi:MJ0042 family finger-like domain-containing protein [Thalassovita litoralis]|jgi:predicted Zn finger-like uncharacterized protein|uniref:MJ0042 family finger-like domain-containing protein n=1 Tax=Thalassovita litoralis TaxID=1010611 RepID=A0A521EH92_9RHOB|nr:zinc-ribbon domain-containing protein [Thalassovita litoralis]SMO83222.1 MJ0042 family finger-like domain-containing protein [Thalassovita litoralis]
MRLICPNCGAQYEVPDGVIPEQGRDVQCSSCGHTWFQPHPDQDADLADELGQDLPPSAETDAPTTEPDDVDFAPAPEDAREDDGAEDANDVEDDSFDDQEAEQDAELPDDTPTEDPQPEPQPEPTAPTRRELDPSIAELLREEAEFEARQRAAGGGLEYQPDLGLEEPSRDEATRRAEESRRRMASRQGVDDLDPQDDLTEQTGSRRELLPDIEEINSSLNADSRRPSRADDHAPGGVILPAGRPSGFRRGFALGLLLVVLLWALYVFAAPITAKVPALSAPLASYTQIVDKGRLWLDAKAKVLLVRLDELAAASEK